MNSMIVRYRNGMPERSETGTFHSNRKTRTTTGTVLTTMLVTFHTVFIHLSFSWHLPSLPILNITRVYDHLTCDAHQLEKKKDKKL